MKRIIAWMLVAVMILLAAEACAQDADPLFETLFGLEWSFSSGVGAWSTDMRILEDGSFSGEFHDSDMGDVGDAYPEGTVYRCDFTGQFSVLEQIDDMTWKLHVDSLIIDESQEEEAIDGGVRYVKAAPYGLSDGDEMILYAPGTPLDSLTEDMRFWTHAQFMDPVPEALDSWFLTSESSQSGFISYQSDLSASMPNPWVDLTAEELFSRTGITFSVPEGAEDVVYRFLESDVMSEMQFVWEGGDFCARVQPAALQDGELMNISGMYFDWEYEEDVIINNCKGTLTQTQTGSEDWVQVCQWYDAVPGLMYSVSVVTGDPDGLDLTAIAEQVCIPSQQNR